MGLLTSLCPVCGEEKARGEMWNCFACEAVVCRRHFVPKAYVAHGMLKDERATRYHCPRCGLDRMTDSNKILWGRTIQVNSMRAIASGVAITLMMFIMAGSSPDAPPILPLLFAVPVSYLLFFLPMGVAGDYLARLGVPFSEILQLPAICCVIFGDPLLFMIQRMKPELVPLKLKLVNLKHALLIYDQ